MPEDTNQRLIETGKTPVELRVEGARASEGKPLAETRSRDRVWSVSVQNRLSRQREKEEEGGLSTQCLHPLFMNVSLDLVSKPGLSEETQCPSQLLLPATTKLTSLLSGKWCFD